MFQKWNVKGQPKTEPEMIKIVSWIKIRHPVMLQFSYVKDFLTKKNGAVTKSTVM